MTLPTGVSVAFPIEAFARHCLLNGIDELGYLRSRLRRHRALRSAAARLTRSSMQALIAVLAGDGIGAEVTAEAVRALDARGGAFRPCVSIRVGADRRRRHRCDGRGAAGRDAGAVPARRCDSAGRGRRPEVVRLPTPRCGPNRGCCSCARRSGCSPICAPSCPIPAVLDASPIKAELLHGVDIMVVRELTGGIYFGDKQRTATEAVDVCRYTVEEIERVVRAGGAARARAPPQADLGRQGQRARDLATVALGRRADHARASSPTCAFEHMLVDSAAMHLLKRPRDFDVIVTENMFGDILTDEASMLAGSMGLLPSASLGAHGRGGLFEPIHGSAPDIAGRGIANPYAAILSAALLLRYALELETEARAVEAAVSRAVDPGALPADLAAAGAASVTTRAAGDAVLAATRSGAFESRRARSATRSRGILDADRHPQQPRADARAPIAPIPPCRHESCSTGCEIRLSTPPSDSASVKQSRPVEERRDRGLAAGELEAQHGAEARLLAPRDLVARMIGRARIVHPRTAGCCASKSTTAAVFSACTRMRACSVRTPRSVRKLSNGAPVTPMAFAHQAQAVVQLRRCRDDRAADHVAVAVQVLGGRMHDQVGAERERLLPERRQKGVVRRHQRAGRVRRIGHRANVDHPQQRIARRLDPDAARGLAARAASQRGRVA